MDSIDFFIAEVPDTTIPLSNVRINYMLTTSTQLSQLSENGIASWSGTSLVWGPSTVPVGALNTWQNFKMNKPIIYDGKSSLIIAWSMDREEYGAIAGGTKIRNGAGLFAKQQLQGFPLVLAASLVLCALMLQFLAGFDDYCSVCAANLKYPYLAPNDW